MMMFTFLKSMLLVSVANAASQQCWQNIFFKKRCIVNIKRFFTKGNYYSYIFLVLFENREKYFISVPWKKKLEDANHQLACNWCVGTSSKFKMIARRHISVVWSVLSSSVALESSTMKLLSTIVMKIQAYTENFWWKYILFSTNSFVLIS